MIFDRANGKIAEPENEKEKSIPVLQTAPPPPTSTFQKYNYQQPTPFSKPSYQTNYMPFQQSKPNSTVKINYVNNINSRILSNPIQTPSNYFPPTSSSSYQSFIPSINFPKSNSNIF